MTMTLLPPGPPSPRFDPDHPIVAPDALRADLDLAGYPIAAYGHVRVFRDARWDGRAVTGLATAGRDANWTDAFVDAVRLETGEPYYDLTPHTVVERGVLRAATPDERRRPVHVPVNGSRTPGRPVQVGVFRLVRPLTTWALPDQAEECMAERLAQGLYSVPYHTFADGDPRELRLLKSLRADLEDAYDLRARPHAQRDALWRHVVRHAGRDRAALAALFAELSAILDLGSLSPPPNPGLDRELSAPGTIF